MSLELSTADLELLREALDSHLYWQVAPPQNRDSGNVTDPRVTGEEHDCDDTQECEDGCWLHAMDAADELDRRIGEEIRSREASG